MVSFLSSQKNKKLDTSDVWFYLSGKALQKYKKKTEQGNEFVTTSLFEYQKVWG